MCVCVAFAVLLLRMQCELLLVAPQDDTRIKFERLATECSVTINRRIDRPDGENVGVARVPAVASAGVVFALMIIMRYRLLLPLIGDETLCDGLSEVWRASACIEFSLLAMAEGGR